MKIKIFFTGILLFILSLGTISAQKNPLLNGVWGIKKGENASFEIDRDSIYYVEHFSRYKLKATNDSIFINLDGYKVRVKYKVTPDSLFWIKRNKITKFVRFTE